MNSITDVPGIRVGQAQHEEGMTGVTVILVPEGAVAGVDVRGAAPGTRETDLLNPANLVEKVNAIALCGGSAFGLAAAQGVVNYLQERGYGFETPFGKVPIVPAAVIYDLGLGEHDAYPDPLMGYLACSVADKTVMEGNFGAGAGASIGKVLGNDSAMKSGEGTASTTLNLVLPNGPSYSYTVGALAVTNAFGDVYDGDRIIAGACRHSDGEFLNTMQMFRDGLVPLAPSNGNTTLGVVATDAPLTKAQACRLAMMAQDGLARAIQPVHTMFDGDVVFALSTGGLPPTAETNPLLLTLLGSLAADVLCKAIQRSVTEARPAGGLPAARHKN
ncbi:MAG TPA: P1 family peptidase [Chloroflexia bacterium]|nr:P1 family peptidase [Chloroflexia bacterium]